MGMNEFTRDEEMQKIFEDRDNIEEEEEDEGKTELLEKSKTVINNHNDNNNSSHNEEKVSRASGYCTTISRPPALQNDLASFRLITDNRIRTVPPAVLVLGGRWSLSPFLFCSRIFWTARSLI